MELKNNTIQKANRKVLAMNSFCEKVASVSRSEWKSKTSEEWFLVETDFHGLSEKHRVFLSIFIAQQTERSYRRGFYQGVSSVLLDKEVLGAPASTWTDIEPLLHEWRYLTPLCVKIGPGRFRLAELSVDACEHKITAFKASELALKHSNVFQEYLEFATRELIRATQRFYGRRQNLSKKRRFQVLEKFNFCCCYCGRKAGDGIELHVDHVKPVSKGGTNCDENLVAACRDCNLGKGAREIKANGR